MGAPSGQMFMCALPRHRLFASLWTVTQSIVTALVCTPSRTKTPELFQHCYSSAGMGRHANAVPSKNG